MKQTIIFRGEKYQRKTTRVTKMKARVIAESYRNQGAKAHIVKEITPQGTLYVIYRRG